MADEPSVVPDTAAGSELETAADSVAEALAKVSATESPDKPEGSDEAASAAADGKTEDAAEAAAGGDDDFKDLFPGGEVFPAEEAQADGADERATEAKESLRQLVLTGDADLDDPAVAEKIVGAIIRSGPGGQRLLDSRQTLKDLETELGYEPSGEELTSAVRAHQQHQRILSDLESASPEEPKSMGPILAWLIGDSEQPQEKTAEAFVVGVVPFLEQNYPQLGEYLMRESVLGFADRIERSASTMKSETDRKNAPEIAKWLRYFSGDGKTETADHSRPNGAADDHWRHKFEELEERQNRVYTESAFDHLHGVVLGTVKAAYGTLLEKGGYTARSSQSIIGDLAREVDLEIDQDVNYRDTLYRQVRRGVPADKLAKQHASRARAIIRRMAPKRMPELVKNFSASLLENNHRAHERASNGTRVSGAGASATASAAEPRRVIEPRKPDENPEQWRRSALDRAADLTLQKHRA